MTALQAEGCGGGFAADYKVSVTGLAFYIIWHDKHSAIGSLRSPTPIRLRRTSPCSGGRINCSMLFCRDMVPWLSIHSPTTKWGEGGGASHQRGGECISDARRAVVKVLAAKGGIKNGAKSAVPRQRARSANQ